MKTPFVSHAQLLEITKAYPTPFHLYDEGGIRQSARALRRAFAWNPGFCEFFAVKALPNPFILQILKEEGCGVDCSSYTELLLAKACGFPPEKIMFSSNQTPAEEYRLAMALGAHINLDDITHIDFLRDVAGLPSQISCRYNPGGEFAVGNDIMDTPQEAKFGFTRQQLAEGFTHLRTLGVEEFGLHAFLASNTAGDAYYPELARILFQLAAELQGRTGARITQINLSGGIGVAYRPEQQPSDIQRISEGVRQAYEQILVPAGMGGVALCAELGRFMTGPHGCLVTRAIHAKHIHKEYIGVDSSAVDLIRPAMYGAYHHITVAGKEGAPNDHTYDVVGSLCENNDKFAVDRALPKIDTGDLLVIHDTGAHGSAMGYNYNGKLHAAELLLCQNGDVRLIRRAQTPQDYFSTLDFSAEFEFGES
ncbi:MAG: diaminopimelate decarboxylase [Clostridia bacterium]|nr:diaminopimelate decarboxylase [Clostridia bacterium]